MEILNEQLNALIERLSNSDNFHDELERIKSIYPFSKYEYIISTLFSRSKITFKEYLDIRDEYINRNLWLYVFEISAPRGFGDTWALGHLMGIEPEFKRPNRHLDNSYKGEYDLYLNWINGIRKQHYIKIEVKASRATDREKNEEPLYIKALTSDSKRPFLMNYQQLKPKCCDVYLWIAVYRDKIKYWVINSKEIQTNKDFTPQHRNEGTSKREKGYSKEDIYEGQIMLTEGNITQFDGFLVTNVRDLKNKVIDQYKIQYNL
jgi:hypothetical protein